MLKLIFFVSLFLFVCSQVLFPADVLVKYVSNQPQNLTNVCYTFCKTCQINSLQSCNSCESPYLKTIPPICNITDTYTMVGWELWIGSQQSTQTGNVSEIFSISSYWTTDNLAATSKYCGSYVLYGPFTNSQSLNYSKILPQHSFIIIKFFFVRINWIINDTVTFNYTADKPREKFTLQYVSNGTNSNLKNLSLCDKNFVASNDSKGILANYELKYYDKSSQTFNASFMGRLSENAAWGINTFLIITGACSTNCWTCGYDSSPTGCLTCINLLIRAPDSSCSLCNIGYYLININQCHLCPINCTQCNYNTTTGNVFCTACPNQQFKYDSVFGLCYYDQKSQNFFMVANQLSDSLFSFSLFQILTSKQNLTISTCGYYSIVGGIGIASQNTIISRTYLKMRPHVSIAIRLNFLKIDKPQNQIPNILYVAVDNILLLNVTIIANGQSNQCGGPQLESYVTVSSIFVPHSNQQNVNFAFSSNANIWGIRDVFITINNCGNNCAYCAPTGCQACNGFIKLNGVSCEGCIPGFAAVGSNCVGCNITCETCDLKTRKCLSCAANYLLLNGECILYPGLIQMHSIQAVNGPNSTFDIAGWNYSAPDNSTNSYNCTFVDITNINPLYSMTQPLFLISKNTAMKVWTNLIYHYKIRVKFLLLKIDQWDAQQYVNLYLNDLLVMHEEHNSVQNRGGNNICGNKNQNDMLSKKDIEIFDQNSTLTAYFEMESKTDRYFGIRGFIIILNVCPHCNSTSFIYHVQYSIVNGDILVYLIFNRPIVNYLYNLTFQEIFQIRINQIVYNYTTTKISDFKYQLYVTPNISFINAVLAVDSLYSPSIVTHINSPIYQINAQSDYQNSYPMKYLETYSKNITLGRYDPVGISASNPFPVKNFFYYYTKIILYLSLLSFFFGWQDIFITLVHNIQKIWLHIYIATSLLPSNFKIALQGFRPIQNLNFFADVHQMSIQYSLIPYNVYYETPFQFLQYYTDITFTRNIYAVVIYCIIIFGIFGIVKLLFYKFEEWSKSQYIIMKHFRYIITRVFWFFNSVIFFQYITLCFSVFSQFVSPHTDLQPFNGLNLTATILGLLFALGWPVFQFYYIRQQEENINFDYLYKQIFQKTYRQKKDFFENYKISFYELFRYILIISLCLIIALIHQPFVQIILLVILFFVYFWLTTITFVNHNLFYYTKLFQFFGIIGIQVIILLSYTNYANMSPKSFILIGSVGIFFIYMCLISGFIRIIPSIIEKIHHIKIIPNFQSQEKENLFGEQIPQSERKFEKNS